MHLDVNELSEFYTNNSLGAVVRRSINPHIAEFWPSLRDKTLVGYGYALPVLEPFLEETPHLLALMPAQQGVISWPKQSQNKSVLGEETRWPFGAGQIERLIALHGLETSERPVYLLEECHRVLSEDGEAIFIVPNRAGFWARFDSTPFGVGRPYSYHQLEKLFTNAGFHILKCHGALFMPPLVKKIPYRLDYGFGFLGRRLRSIFPPGLWIIHVKRETIAIAPRRKAPQKAKIIPNLPNKGLKPA